MTTTNAVAKKTLTVRNNAQRALFLCEIAGQLSDGHWENASPRGHYRPWIHAQVVVDPSNVGRDFWADKDNYGLNSKDLLDAVGGRMLNYARLANEFTVEEIELLDHCTNTEGGWTGVPTYVSEYYDKVRLSLAQLGAEKIERARALITDESTYTMKHLRADLRDLKVAFRTKK